MNPKMIALLFEIGGAMAQHIWQAIESDDQETLRKLSEVWPKPIRSSIALMQVEHKARQRVGGE